MRNYKFWFITTVISSIFIMSLMLLIQIGSNPAPVRAQTDQTNDNALLRTITVIGEGTANIEPDIAQAVVGVQISNRDLEEATSEAQQRMEAILTALQDQGVAEQDIQTANFNIFVERLPGPEGQLTDELLYRVNNEVRVIIRDLDNISPVLNAAIEAGANNIYGVNFSIDDPSTGRAQAREDAINNASSKAQDLARLANVQLGEVVRISEIISSPIIPFAQAEALGGGGPIVPGQLEVTVRLEVVYAMQ
jgi:uncharacterized protein YggE